MWGQFDVYWYILEAGGFCPFMPIFIVGGGENVRWGLCPTLAFQGGWTGGSPFSHPFSPFSHPSSPFSHPLFPFFLPCSSPFSQQPSPFSHPLSPFSHPFSPFSHLLSLFSHPPSPSTLSAPYIRLRDCSHKNQFLLGRFAQTDFFLLGRLTRDDSHKW